MDPSYPYQPPESPVSQLKLLGSLAQSARGKHLHQARNILLIIGALTAALNGFMFSNAPNEVNNAIQAQQLNPAHHDQILRFVRLIYGWAFLLGVLSPPRRRCRESS